MNSDQAAFLDGFELKGRWYPIIRGAEGSNDSGTGDGTSADNDGGTSADNDGGDNKGDKKDEKLFTQDQLNAIAAREAEKAKRGKVDPKELGFDNAKEMKEYLDKAKEQADSQKSESEKALEEAVTKAKADAEAGVLSKANERVLRAEFLIAAVKAEVKLPNDAFVLAQTLEDWKSVEVSDDGNVTGLDEAFFETLKEAKPFLWGEDDDGSGTDIGAGATGAGKKGSVAAREEELKTKYPSLSNRK